MRRAPRLDGNHADVVNSLFSIGCKVQSLAGCADGVPDLLVGCPDGRLIVIEVKDGSLPPSHRVLTVPQEKWHAWWKGWPVYVATSGDEAIKFAEGA